MTDFKYYPRYMDHMHALTYGGKIYLSDDGINWRELDLNNSKSQIKFNKDMTIRKIKKKMYKVRENYNQLNQEFILRRNIMESKSFKSIKIYLAITYFLIILISILKAISKPITLILTIPSSLMYILVTYLSYRDLKLTEETRKEFLSMNKTLEEMQKLIDELPVIEEENQNG